MEVILLSSVRGLGAAGDLVKVKPGYANNYLIPTGKAVFASQRYKEYYEQKRTILLKNEETLIDAAKVIRENLNGKVIDVEVPADKKGGALYAAIHTSDIAEIINSKFGYDITALQVISTSIKLVGEYSVLIYPHPEVKVMVMLNVKPSA